ncbi:hypothetical protein AB9F42_34245, partial [Rhizobium leguminosarum]
MAKITNVAVQMDHVAGINIAGYSTFAMSLEAQARGYKLFHYTPDLLSFRDGKLEFFNPIASVKDRIGVEMIEGLEAQGKITPGKTVL